MQHDGQADTGRSHKSEKEILRRQVVREVADGTRPAAVAQALDVNIRTVYRWLAEYRDGGMEALKARPIPGRPPKLDDAQIEEFRRAILTRTPADYGLHYGVWSVQLARQLVTTLWDLQLSQVSVTRLLQRFVELRRQRPLQQAEARQPIATARWLRFDYPDVNHCAKAAGAQLLFGQGPAFDALLHDRAAASAKGPFGAPRQIGPRLFLALNSRGRMSFLPHHGEVTPDALCRFLRHLVQGREQPIHLVLEPCPALESEQVRQELALLGERLTPVFLPAGETAAAAPRQTGRTAAEQPGAHDDEVPAFP